MSDNNTFFDLYNKVVNFDETKLYPIYHYTSPQGLDGIIKSGGMWFTNVDYLNDFSEGNYIIDCLHNCAQSMHATNQISEVTFKKVMKIEDLPNEGYHVTYGRANSIIIEEGEYDVFVCCFSSDQDNLNLWRYYVKNETYSGYNIGFCENPFTEVNYTINDTIHCFRVLANELEHFNLIQSLLLWLEKNIKNESSLVTLISFLQDFRYIFKNPCFESEHEIRIVLKVSKKKPMYDVKYRMNTKGVYIPYVEVPFFKNNFYNITVAPMTDFALAKQSLISVMKQNGYDFDIKNDINNIRKSNCPVRF